MELGNYVIVSLVGLFAGFINVIVGSGSSVTVPLLIFLGLPPHIALGTNRFAMMFNNATGAVRYHAKQYLHVKIALIVSLFAVAGAVIGAYLVLAVTPGALKKVIAVLLIVEVIILIFNRKGLGLERRTSPFTKSHYFIGCIFGFLAGIYGGFLGMAITSILMFFLAVLFKFSFLESAAAAKVLAFTISLAAAIVFLAKAKVDFPVGIILTVSYIIGGYLGVHAAIKMGDFRIKVLFILVLFASAFFLIFDFGIKI